MPYRLNVTSMGLMGCLLSVVLLTTGLQWQPVTDEELHTEYSRQITMGVSEWTGSIVIGRTVATMVGYLKEASDILLGKSWSQDDLDANLEGIYSVQTEAG
jgi:hypothetical protein